MARALDGNFNSALLFGREAGALAAHNAAMRVYELLQKLHVFVIDVADVVLG